MSESIEIAMEDKFDIVLAELERFIKEQTIIENENENEIPIR